MTNTDAPITTGKENQCSRVLGVPWNTPNTPATYLQIWSKGNLQVKMLNSSSGTLVLLFCSVTLVRLPTNRISQSRKVLVNTEPDVAYPTSGPDPTEDLIDVYGLGRIAGNVARNDPVTGEKINRLRKSYEGKLKDFNLAGKNKPHKVEDVAPGSLIDLMMIPEEQWQIQAHGKDAGLHSADSQTKFERAMKMDRGVVSKNDYWEDVLGHEKPKPAAFAFETTRKSVLGGEDRQIGLGNGISLNASSEASRPRRANRKRRYDDKSFEGYGEGYVDDEAVTEGTYSDEDGRPSGKKRRKKVD